MNKNKVLYLILLTFILICIGCQSPNIARDIKAEEINITHSTPWTTVNINAKNWDSSANYKDKQK